MPPLYLSPIRFLTHPIIFFKTQPMKPLTLDLQAITDEGENFTYDQLSDETLGRFNDLLGDRPFKVDINVFPIGNSYQITGTVSSAYGSACSLCGHDIELPLSTKINEIIVIEKERPRNTQVSQSQQNFDGGPSVTYVNSPSLDLGEFIHEMFAVGFADYPKCMDKALCDSRRISHHMVSDKKEKTGHPAFASLKSLKI